MATRGPSSEGSSVLPGRLPDSATDTSRTCSALTSSVRYMPVIDRCYVPFPTPWRSGLSLWLMATGGEPPESEEDEPYDPYTPLGERTPGQRAVNAAVVALLFALVPL